MKKHFKRLSIASGLFAFLMSVIAYPLFGDVIQDSRKLIIVAAYIAIAVAVYLFINIYLAVMDISDWKDLKVKYIHEPAQDDGSVREGRVFKEMCHIVEMAETEIIAVSSRFRDGKKSTTTEHPQRKKYLQQLEKTIQGNLKKGFKYVRIHQSPEAEENEPLIQKLGELNFHHFKNALLFAQGIKNEKSAIRVLKVRTRHPASFMIIDRKYILWQTNRLDVNGNPGAAGSFFFEDNKGDLVNYLLNEYEALLSLATPFTLSEFG